MNQRLILLSLVCGLLIISLKQAIAANNETLYVEDGILTRLNLSDEVEVVISIDRSVDFASSLSRADKINKLKEEIKKKKKDEGIILSKLENNEFRLLRLTEFGNGFRGKLTGKGLQKLNSLQNLGFNVRVEIPKDGSILLEESRPLINAPIVWDISVENTKINGSGKTICVIDSGVNAGHPYLSGKIVAQKCYCVKTNLGNGGCCPNQNITDTNATDDNGHGTHISSIITSSGSIKGIAPGAKLAVAKITNASGYYDIQDLRQAITWCSLQPNVTIISMSVGTTAPLLYNNSFFCQDDDINNAHAMNITLIAASGNDASPTLISHPACNDKVIPVGATYDVNFKDKFTYRETENGPVVCEDINPEQDNVVCITNSGNLLNLLAPGANILAADISGVATHAGTSEAAPHVSGTIALLQQYYNLSGKTPLTLNETKKVLNYTGVPILDSRNGRTYYRIDAAAAISYITTRQLGTTTDTITGSVRKGQTWYTKLNVTNMNGNILKVDLEEDFSGHDLDLSLIAPNGTTYTAPEQYSGESLELAGSSIITGNNWTLRVYADNVPSGVDSSFVVSTIKKSVPADKVDEKFKGKPGGVNFTSTQVSFITTCDAEEGTALVFKAKEANLSAGDSVINITERTKAIEEAFKTGLVIPNKNMWVSLPIGGVDIDKTFAETWVSRQLLEDDVDLKFAAINEGEPNIIKDVYDNWSATGGSGYPDWWFRFAIIAGNVVVNASGCEIFITNVTMNVDTELMSASGNHPNISSWKNYFTNKLENDLLPIKKTSVNNDTEFKYLREVVYPAITLAQWYKTLPREKLLWGDIIDSNNVSGLEANTSFDYDYWKGQSKQFLYWIPSYPVYVHGGVSWRNANVNQTGGLSNATKDLIKEATTNSYAQQGNDYYYTTAFKLPLPNLKPFTLGFSTLTPTPNESLNVTLAVQNTGELNASNFSVYFYHTFIYSDGNKVNEKISEMNVSLLKVGEIALINISWNTSLILGFYNITAVIDYTNSVKESNELDNTKTKKVKVYTDYPIAAILSPAANVIKCGVVTFTGSGSDPQEGSLNSSRLNWTSSRDGYLGNGSSISVNLSVGAHSISLTAKDSEGFTGTSSMPISIVACNKPVPEILSPLPNRTYAEGEVIYFVGNAMDEEDGAIPNASLTWNSSVAGLLGTGGFVSSNALAVGNHTITLKAVDITDLVGLAIANITVVEGNPNISITSPTNNQMFIHKAIIAFNASSIDPQDGDISSSVVWTSSIDGSIGSGKKLSRNLSVGFHTITAAVTDSHGLGNRTSVNITVEAPRFPTASIISPKHTQVFTHGSNITFKGSYSDYEDATIPNSSLVWNSSIDGVKGNSTDFVSNNFSIGNHTIYFTVIDSDGMSSAAQVNVTVSPAPPVPVIVSPAHGSIFAQIANITFNGTATDYEDGPLFGTSLNWTSSKDGVLGNGTIFNRTSLSVGTHLITLTARDSTSLTTSQSANIIVVGPNQVLVNKLADGSKAKNVTYTTAGNKTEYVSLPKSANVTYAAINIKGHSP